MKRQVLTAAVIAALGCGLAACETATPYQAAAPGGARTAGGYGFSDYRIDDVHWRVTFAGNSMTSRETVEKYLLYRAAELTRQQGFDWFQTTDRHTERSTSYIGDADPFYHSGFWASYGWGWAPSWRYGGAWGWRSWDPWFGGPFWTNSIDIREVDRYEASAEIMMGKGQPPAGQRAFNAEQVLANVGPSVVRPS
jgi:hypothetical protein